MNSSLQYRFFLFCLSVSNTWCGLLVVLFRPCSFRSSDLAAFPAAEDARDARVGRQPEGPLGRRRCFGSGAEFGPVSRVGRGWAGERVVVGGDSR